MRAMMVTGHKLVTRPVSLTPQSLTLSLGFARSPLSRWSLNVLRRCEYPAGSTDRGRAAKDAHPRPRRAPARARASVKMPACGQMEWDQEASGPLNPNGLGRSLRTRHERSNSCRRDEAPRVVRSPYAGMPPVCTACSSALSTLKKREAAIAPAPLSPRLLTLSLASPHRSLDRVATAEEICAALDDGQRVRAKDLLVRRHAASLRVLRVKRACGTAGGWAWLHLRFLCAPAYPRTLASSHLRTFAPSHPRTLAPSHPRTRAPVHPRTRAPAHQRTSVPPLVCSFSAYLHAGFRPKRW